MKELLNQMIDQASTLLDSVRDRADQMTSEHVRKAPGRAVQELGAVIAKLEKLTGDAIWTKK